MTLWLALAIGFGVGSPAGFIVGVHIAPHLSGRTCRKVVTVRHAIWGLIQRHTAWVALLGVLIGVLASIGAALGYQYALNQVNAKVNCNAAYLNGSAVYAQARDAAVQRLWDDFAGFNTGKKPTPGQVKDFFRDLASEQHAAHDLAHYRATHVPKEAC